MSGYASPVRDPLITGSKTYAQITEDIVGPVEQKGNLKFWIALAISAAFMGLYFVLVGYTVWQGIGVWGENKTIGWAWDITNFVWWVGIGHAGTLISAILLLFRQKWRTGVNRSAEAMTIFAVVCAGQFPLIHMGRIWKGFFIFPYPNSRAAEGLLDWSSLWPNFQSPLLWDVFAISTYLTISLLFWYTGLVPDLATVRDRATGLRRKIYSHLSFAWQGTARQWQRFESISLVLAGLSTPLVLSVHSVVSFDFATSVIYGWHTTIFPPYFVAGAVFSGFAMVLTLMLVARSIMNLQDYITVNHIESMNKVILLTGSIVGVAYLTELFMAFYSANPFEEWVFKRNRIADPYIFGPMMGVEAAPYWWAYWAMMTCNVISPQIFWFKKMRRNLWVTFVMSIFINIGMWFERFVIIVTSLHRDFIPSSWSYYQPTWVEIGIFVGTMGLFMTLFLLFCKFAPVVAVAEVKSILKTSGDQYMNRQAVIDIKEGAGYLGNDPEEALPSSMLSPRSPKSKEE